MNIVFFSIILLPFYSPTQSEWISHSNNTLPREDTMFAIGSYNGNIHLLGGFNKKRQQTIYDINTDSFVFYRSLFLSNKNKVFGTAQFWTQIESNLYILDDLNQQNNKISVLNMETNTFISEFVSIPVTLSDGIGRACITSSSDSIFINGGISDQITMKSTYVLHIPTMLWGVASPMQTARRSHSC
eukprot:61932_1